MFGRILLPLDPSKNLEAATEYAISLARRMEIPLKIIDIVNPGKTGLGPKGKESRNKILYSLAERELKRAVKLAGEIEFESSVETGERSKILAQIAEHKNNDLTVLGPFRTFLSRLFTGSETERIVEMNESHCLVIRKPAPLPGAGSPILVVFDGKELSKECLDEIEKLVLSFDADVELLHLGKDMHGGVEALDAAVTALKKNLPETVHVTCTIEPLSWFPYSLLRTTNKTVKKEGARLVVLPEIDGAVSKLLIHELILNSKVPVCVLK